MRRSQLFCMSARQAWDLSSRIYSEVCSQAEAVVRVRYVWGASKAGNVPLGLSKWVIRKDHLASGAKVTRFLFYKREEMIDIDHRRGAIISHDCGKEGYAIVEDDNISLSVNHSSQHARTTIRHPPPAQYDFLTNQLKENDREA